MSISANLPPDRSETVPHLISRAVALSFVALWLLVAAPLAHAQDSATTGTLAGSVRDAAAAAIPSVAVTLRNLTTNQSRSATTGNDGEYRLVAVPAGDYEVRAEGSGFAPYMNAAVTIVLGRVTTLDITLAPAEVNVLVTVSERPPAIDPTETATTTSIDPERIEELPINIRNYLQFTLLAPGVAPSSPQQTGGSGSSSGAPLADSGFTFGGLRARSNSISIDGLDNTDETTGAARVALSPEIIREFQVINNGMSAEFGGAAGGAINVITRTGSNEIHGDAFSFIQNEAFNAREPAAGNRNRFRRFQPGFALGGPVKLDRLFFYLALEQEHLSTEEQSEIAPATRGRVNSALAAGVGPRLPVRGLLRDRFPTGRDETEAAGKLTYIAGQRNTLNFRFAFTNDRARRNAFNSDILSDPTARGSAYTKDYQFTASAISILSARLINDLRFQASTRQVTARSGDTNGPGIEITGVARFGRPFAAVGARRETRVQVVDNVTLVRAKEEWKAGVTVDHVALRDAQEDGFGGLFVFRTVDDFAASRPAVWRQSFGDSRANVGITSFGGFLLDQWRATPRLTLNLGARYDVEGLPSPFRTDWNNISPRIGLAWSPAKEWVLRGGVGVFYDRLPLAFLGRAIEKNGIQAFEQVATDDRATEVFAATGGGRAISPVAGIAPSIFRADPNFVTPYSVQVNAGVERQLSQNLTVRATYLFTRGIHLPRTRNINLLPPVVLTTANAAQFGLTAPDPQQIGRAVFLPQRVDPRFDAIYQLEDSAKSRYNGITVAVDKRLSDEFELLASYTLSKTTDDASDFDEQPANPFDLRAERALSRLDLRHRFVTSALFDLPFGEGEAGKDGRSDWLENLLSHIEVGAIVTLSSGRPVNPLTGADEELSQAFPLASRPKGFVRNGLTTARYFNTDLRALKYIPFGGRRRLDLVVELFNLFNHPHVNEINPFYGSGAAPLPTFGTPALFGPPRQVRFSLDLEF